MTDPSARPGEFSAAYFRSALGRFPTGVTVVTADDPDSGKPLGLTISSFTSVSLEPPLILWTLVHTARTLPAFRRLERYVVHVLSAQQAALAQRFAQGPQPERFRGLALARAPGGARMLDDPHCAAWFECTNQRQHEAGDHTVFIGRVEHCHREFLAPLVYHAGHFELTPEGEPLSER